LDEPSNFEPVTWEEYLISKKIDSATFRQAEPERWQNWQREFEQINPNSFTSQKLYLINPIRRKYPLKAGPEIKTAEPAASRPKPVIRPKFK
jgi:hypothetical protein